MPSSRPAPETSPARAALANHLAEIAATRTRIAELRILWERLLEPERRAHTDQVCRESLQRENEELVSAWLAASLEAPGEGNALPDFSQYALEVEDERLRYFDRVIAATKPAKDRLSAQSTAAVQKLTALEEATPTFVAEVFLEQAVLLAEQISVHLGGARSRLARSRVPGLSLISPKDGRRYLFCFVLSLDQGEEQRERSRDARCSGFGRSSRQESARTNLDH